MPKKINLSGSWNVRVSQKIKKKHITYNIECNICQVDNRIIGSLIYNLGQIDYRFTSNLNKKSKWNIAFNGNIIKDRLQFVYNNSDRKIQQMGSVILNILSEKSMEGLFIGYGPESEALISGKLKFKKQ